jgi:hypothetical protein
MMIVAGGNSLYFLQNPGFSPQQVFQPDAQGVNARVRAPTPQLPDNTEAPMLVQNGVSAPYFPQVSPPVTPAVVTQVIQEQVSIPHSVTTQPSKIMQERAPFDLENWLVTNADSLDRENAFAALFDSWNLSPPEEKGINQCDYALADGLKCLKLQGNWNRLADINRPAILSVNTNDQRTYYLPVIGVEDTLVSIQSSDGVERIPRDELENHWYGEFELLWKAPPPGDVTLLKPGDQGPEIEWLRDRLSEITGIDVEPVGEIDLFDEKLAEVVRIFQVMNRLQADSVVGPHTMIRLNSASPVDTGPRIKAKS